MASKLTKPVTREVAVTDSNGVEGAVNATFTADGVTLQGKGTSRKLHITWEALAAASPAPPSIPAKFSANHLGWLVDRKPAKEKTPAATGGD